MRLFEAFYPGEKWNYFCRYYDTETKSSNVYEIQDVSDLYAECDAGPYTHLITKKRYKKIHPREKNKYGESELDGKCNAGLVHVRNNYWKFEGSDYNKNPSIFYLDIETTARAPVDILACRERIVSIQIFHNLSNTNIILALEDIVPKSQNGFYEFDKVYDFKIKYIRCEDEADILKKYFEIVRLLKPLLVIAHNGEGFDFKYLWSRTEKCGIAEHFSPYGASKLSDKSKDGKLSFSIDAPGVFYMDNLVIYKRFRLAPRSSYSLDALAEVELGEHKVKHDCYATFDGFRTGKGYIRPNKEPEKESKLEYALYHAKSENEIEKISREWFLHYSIIDTYLLYKMDAKLKLTNILISLASIMGINVNNAVGTVQPWSNYIRNYCATKNQIVPGFKGRQGDPVVVGGFVKDPKPGKYEWVYSVDVTSMYPSEMMAFNMSPDTFIPEYMWPRELKDEVERLKLSTDEQYHLKEYFNDKSRFDKLKSILRKYNIAGSLNGAFFTRDFKGVIPILVEHVFKQRKETKNKMLSLEKLYEETKNESHKTQAAELDIYQNALKIAINGLYGALGNPVFDMFNEAIANAITANSRFYVQLFSKNIEVTKNNPAVYNDTDSLYSAIPTHIRDKIRDLEINEKINRIDEYIENEIQPVVNGSSQELGDIFNAIDASKISAKREVIAEKAVFIAKKRYIMKIWDSEGVRFSEPHLKMMGIDLVRSSTPTFSKKYLKDSINIILDKSEKDLKTWTQNTKAEFQKVPLLDIAKTSSVNSAKYEIGKDKSIPINSRAFLVTNQYIKDNNLTRFEPLEVGEKVKMLYLKMPNPLNSNIFAFSSEDFAQMFKEYIDYDTNFDKFFMSPLKIMTEPLEYNLDKKTEELEEW